MNSLTLIVQSDINTVNTAPMAEAARSLGVPVVDIALGFPPEDIPPIEGVPFFYGSVGFLRWVRPSLQRYIAWDEVALSPVTWAGNLGEMYLNHDGMQCAAGDAPLNWHVRPICNDKSFAGTIAPVAVEHRDVPAWVAPPKQIDEEVRVFVVGNKFVQASIYRRNGLHYREPCVPPDIPATIWAPFPNCVVDLALVEGRWRIVEFNSIHTSGLYACNPVAILSAVQNAAR